MELVDLLTLWRPTTPYTASLTSKRYILYIYSTNICTEYFKHGIYSPFFPLQNAVCFIILTYLVPVLFTFYIQGVLKLKKRNSGAKRLKPTGYVMHQQFNIQQLYALPTLYLCVLYLSENKQRLVPLTA